MKKVFAILFLLAGLTSAGQNQDQDEERFVDKLRFGGNTGGSFGSAIYLIEISPFIGYQATDRWMPGIGGTYLIDIRLGYANSYYGFRHFHQFDLTSSIFAWGEYELLNGKLWDPFDQQLKRQWSGNLFIGGGFRQRPLFLVILYNLTYEGGRSGYGSPLVIRVGRFF